MRYNNNDLNNSIEQFAQATAIINPVAIANFFEATCTSNFHQLLNIKSHESGLLELILTYFRTIETNG